jgi:hypothetical protein
MALADPTFQTIDRLLPQLEALASRGDDAFRVVRDIPGVGAFGRITGLSGDAGAKSPTEKVKPEKRPRRPKS